VALRYKATAEVVKLLIDEEKSMLTMPDKDGVPKLLHLAEEVDKPSADALNGILAGL
jgi:hypothetical protein